MTTIEAILLGLLQGFTEFLPVSSSGHLEIGKEILGVTVAEDSQLTFSVLVHCATVLATITIFAREIWGLICGGLKFRYNAETQYLLKIALSMIPVGVVGVFFKDEVESLFGGSIYIVGAMLLVTAALLTFSHFFVPRKSHPVTYRDSFIIGLAQAFAVLPGVSRSGSTIATGLMLGVDRKLLAKFSFLMVLVPILGETFLELIGGKFSPEASGIPTVALVAGFLAAYFSGLIACQAMIKIVSKGKLYYFAIYCAILAMVIFIFG
ncbi:MAG: undecaprenyl-diphosphate phosphatase [Rikenellaceae bacterium]